jgi:hypothetical protein
MCQGAIGYPTWISRHDDSIALAGVICKPVKAGDPPNEWAEQALKLIERIGFGAL